jgi:hypothetical protein
VDGHTQQHRGYAIMIGLMSGTFVGTGLAMWHRACGQSQQVRTRVGQAIDGRTRKGREARDDVADAVARGTHEVERHAAPAKTDDFA